MMSGFGTIRLLGLLASVAIAMVIGGVMQGQDRGLLLVVVPEEDTTVTPSAVYRLSGSTRPGCTVALDGVPQRLYSSGAFAGLLRLQVGENRFTLLARDPEGRTQGKTLLLIRKPPLESTRSDTLAIENERLEPAEDLWLRAGDVLNVRCKGTPGCRATFLDGLPMVELPDSVTGGVRGVYQGSCVVTDRDLWDSTAVTFRLVDSAGHEVAAETPGRVTVLSGRTPLVGITQGERPFLNYGLGDDRLGGAKMSILGPGIRLAINGKAGRLLRVALAEDQEAWIPEQFVRFEPRGTPPPFTLAGSWNVYGDNRADYVSISLRDRIPYVTFTETDPSRLCVDLFGAVSNSNWITQHLTTKEIQNVSYRQVGKNVVRVSIELRHKQIWGYSVGYRGQSLIIRIRRQPESCELDRLSFILDAGHGGEHEGAIGATGAKEKDINLATVLHLRRLLQEEGAKVVLTRSTDSTIATSDRLGTALSSDADMLISVHANAIGYTSNPVDVKGTSTYYRHLCFRPLSQAIYDQLLQTGLAPFGNVGGFNFLLNSPTELPNVLVELAFMSHPLDEIRLLDDGFREELAEKIVEGVKEFLENAEE
jgi:N-acetylmuramoyl-L-alanine amidase